MASLADPAATHYPCIFSMNDGDPENNVHVCISSRVSRPEGAEEQSPGAALGGNGSRRGYETLSGHRKAHKDLAPRQRLVKARKVCPP